MVCKNTNLTKRTPKRNKNRRPSKTTLIWSYFCINRNSAKTLRGLPGKTGLELQFRFDLLSQFRSVCLTPLQKCLPKSCHVLKRAIGLVWVCQFQRGHIGKHHDIENIQNCLAEPRHSKQAAGCQAGQRWASGSS